MGETDWHVKLMANSITALSDRYEDEPGVYVAGNNFIYYVEGDPKKCVSPDTYVVFGVPKRDRDCYKAWEEGGKLPDVVFEFTSKSTRTEDLRTKFTLYEQVFGVREYYLFDPRGQYLRPRLHGYRLEDGRYQRMEMANGRLWSEVLGLELVEVGEWLRFWDPDARDWLLTSSELKGRAKAEAAARAEAVAEIARLRRLLDGLE